MCFLDFGFLAGLACWKMYVDGWLKHILSTFGVGRARYLGFGRCGLSEGQRQVSLV